MRIIQIKNGVLILPDDPDIILVDNAAPHECTSAGFVETRWYSWGIQPYREYEDCKMPNFVFFHNLKSNEAFPEALEKDVYDACVKKYPAFRKVLEIQRPEDYSSNESKIAHFKYPHAYLYHILRYGDVGLLRGYKFEPFRGMYIVHHEERNLNRGS